MAIVLVVLTAWLVRGTIPFVPAFDPRAWGRLMRLVLPYAAASAIGAMYVSLVVVLTSLVATQQETGYFSAAFRVFSVLSAVPSLLVASAFPILARAARDDRERLRYALQRLWDTALVIGAGAAVLTAVGAPVAIRVIAGPDYEPSVAVLRIMAGALFASFFVAIWGSGCSRSAPIEPPHRQCDRACRRRRPRAPPRTRVRSRRSRHRNASGRARARGRARPPAHVVVKTFVSS